MSIDAMDAMKRKEAIDSLRQRAKGFARRVAPVYRLLKWCWLDGHKPPPARMLEVTIGRLIDHLERNAGVTFMRTGGLEVLVDEDETGCVEATVRLAVNDTKFM